MVKIALEDNQIRTGEVEEEIRGLGVEIPESVSSAPERVLLVNPFALFLVLLR